MPRQLPWMKSNGNRGRSRTHTLKPSSRGTKPTSIPDDIDDEFLSGTVFANSNIDKGKGKAKAASDSDDLLPGPVSSMPQTSKPHDNEAKERAPSSSPPPLPAVNGHPHNEPMRKGVSKGDLRDDEWMMVEDEFLQTANMFTQHLHIAEYHRLKASIEAKKREAEKARPVIAGAQRSTEGAMRQKAKTQENKQKKAIRDVSVSQSDSSGDDRASYRPKPNRAPPSVAKFPQPTTNLPESDSDDLDAPRVPKPKAPSPSTAMAVKPLPAMRSRPEYLHTTRFTPESFVKPALPAMTTATRPHFRPTRMTPFEMLDEYTPPAFNTRAPPAPTGEGHASASSQPRSRSTSSSQLIPQTLQPTISQADRPQRSVDVLDEWDTLKDEGGTSKRVADRIAKRNAGRAEGSNGKEQRRATDLDDIPTFLF